MDWYSDLDLNFSYDVNRAVDVLIQFKIKWPVYNVYNRSMTCTCTHVELVENLYLGVESILGLMRPISCHKMWGFQAAGYI